MVSLLFSFCFLFILLSNFISKVEAWFNVNSVDYELICQIIEEASKHSWLKSMCLTCWSLENFHSISDHLLLNHSTALRKQFSGAFLDRTINRQIERCTELSIEHNIENSTERFTERSVDEQHLYSTKEKVLMLAKKSGNYDENKGLIRLVIMKTGSNKTTREPNTKETGKINVNEEKKAEDYSK